MISLISILAIGFFLGMRHATDPDHVVAVATIVSREKRLPAAAAIGVLWGIGHGLTVTVVGGLIILFGWVIPARLGLAAEFAVGAMLVLLGGLTLWSVFRKGLEARSSTKAGWHAHLHRHGDVLHEHVHGHECDAGHGHDHPELSSFEQLGVFGPLTGFKALRPLLVGIVHGLAGSAAIALLVLGAIPSPAFGLAYLLVFGLGTVCGMLVITLLIALPFSASAHKSPALGFGLRAMSGVLSLGFGLLLMYEIGFDNGLFSENPLWVPH